MSAWYRVTLKQPADCASKGLTVWARRVEEATTELRLFETFDLPIMVRRALFVEMALRWEMENDPNILRRLG